MKTNSTHIELASNGYKKPTPLSKSHKAALCGSRWKDERRIYHADGFEFDCPRKAAEYFGFNRQTFYNRAKSDRHPEWKIQVVREEKIMPEDRPKMKVWICSLAFGIGFSLGLERAGMETVAFCELDKNAQKVLRKHWPDVPIFSDILAK